MKIIYASPSGVYYIKSALPAKGALPTKDRFDPCELSEVPEKPPTNHFNHKTKPSCKNNIFSTFHQYILNKKIENINTERVVQISNLF
jgi:hypothetical protein